MHSTSRTEHSSNKPAHKRNISHAIRIFFLFALPLAIYSSGSAASIHGTVGEVIDGENLTVVSGNHVVKVRLLAVAAPDKDQPYAGVSRQHLSDLVQNKTVVVIYSSLRDGYLVGQVQIGNMDVGAQMIRDGVAWYDKSDEKRLTEIEQRIYGASQDAARGEKRGLWQDASPVSPWDFRKAQAALLTVNTSTVTLPRQPATVGRGNASGLSSEDLMGGMVGPGSIAGKPDMRPISSQGVAGTWIRYQPADRHFSVLAPSDAVEISYPVLDGQGKSIDLHYVVGKSGKTLYFLMWTKGPNGDSTDLSTADQAIKGMVSGINRTLERAGFALTATPGRSVKLSGYSGSQYTLSGGPASGVVRILSKQIGAERELFMLSVLSGPESEASGNDFLNSFQISQK